MIARFPLRAVAPSVAPLCGLAIFVASLLAGPVAAQPYGGWSEHAWNEPGRHDVGWHDAGWGDTSRSHPAAGASREGKVEVARFRAEGAAADVLGKGAISVIPAPAGAGPADERQLATFEAAVVDQLAKAAYDVAKVDPAGGQVAEVRVVHAVVQPPEPPHKPVSGAMTMGVSNHGSMLGMALAVDLSKPAKALVSTRLEARIKDRKTNAVLWEGRAEMVSREGDPHWDDAAIAGRLASALFDGFPGRTGEAEWRR